MLDHECYASLSQVGGGDDTVMAKHTLKAPAVDIERTWCLRARRRENCTLTHDERNLSGTLLVPSGFFRRKWPHVGRVKLNS